MSVATVQSKKTRTLPVLKSKGQFVTIGKENDDGTLKYPFPRAMVEGGKSLRAGDKVKVTLSTDPFHESSFADMTDELEGHAVLPGTSKEVDGFYGNMSFKFNICLEAMEQFFGEDFINNLLYDVDGLYDRTMRKRIYYRAVSTQR